MCGRYALHTLVDDLQRHFGLFDAVAHQPRFNITPSMHLPIVRIRDGRRELATCQWGFVPRWTKGAPRSRPINARSETAADKPYFRSAMRHHRCLVPADGFYEWTHGRMPKQPWYFRREDAGLMAFAGLWDAWESGGDRTESFAILTTGANDVLAPVHDRMPVIVDRNDYDAWLETGEVALLRPYGGKLTAYPVSRAVNTPANDGPELLQPLQDAGA